MNNLICPIHRVDLLNVLNQINKFTRILKTLWLSLVVDSYFLYSTLQNKLNSSYLQTRFAVKIYLKKIIPQLKTNYDHCSKKPT